MPAPRRRCLALAAALALAGGRAAGPWVPAGPSHARPVEVDHAGPHMVALDFDLLRSMAPAGRDLHLFSPHGLEVPFRHLYLTREERLETARVLAVDRTGDGWRIDIDAGAAPAPHQALRFAMTQEALAASVRLESSADRAAWRLLAESDLFRLGAEGELRRATLSYRPTADRFLRLWWPQAAGFPSAESLRIERLPAHGIEQREEAPRCAAGAGATICRLRLAAAGAERLSLELAARGEVGFRLDVAESGAWRPLREGVWRLAAATAATRFAAIPLLVEPAELRLELYGADAPPELTAWAVQYMPQAIWFDAPGSGTYTLAYGSHRRSPAGTAPMTAADREGAVWVESGREERLGPPALPAALTVPGSLLPGVVFARRWPVEAPRAEPGALVRLPLPLGVYPVCRDDLGDLRLAVGDRQLPFLRRQPQAPVAVLARLESRPQPRGDGRSSVELELPGRWLPLSQIELTSPSGPFERFLRVYALDAAPPGAATGARSQVGGARWVCRPRAALPCRLRLPASHRAGERLTLELDDGDNPPLPRLRADLWRRQDELLFVWPQQGGVRLLAGNPDLPPARYDLELLRPELERRPAVEAVLGLAAAADAAGARDRLGRLLLFAALGLAALFLLVLLYRTLRAPG